MAARKHRSELRYARHASRVDSSIGYVVEWQLTPLNEPEAPAGTPAELSDHGA